MNKLMRVDDVADVLDVTKGTVYRMIARKELPEHIRVGGVIRFRPSDIERAFNIKL